MFKKDKFVQSIKVPSDSKALNNIPTLEDNFDQSIMVPSDSVFSDLPLIIKEHDMLLNDIICGDYVIEDNLTLKKIENFDEDYQKGADPFPKDSQKLFDEPIDFYLNRYHETAEDEFNEAAATSNVKQNTPEKKVDSSTTINDILFWPKTPVRKGKKEVERTPFAVTSAEFKEMHLKKINEKKIKEDELKEKKRKREEKKTLKLHKVSTTKTAKKGANSKAKDKKKEKKQSRTVGKTDLLNNIERSEPEETTNKLKKATPKIIILSNRQIVSPKEKIKLLDVDCELPVESPFVSFIHKGNINKKQTKDRDEEQTQERENKLNDIDEDKAKDEKQIEEMENKLSKRRLLSLRALNDIAERAVKLMEDFYGLITAKEEQKQFCCAVYKSIEICIQTVKKRPLKENILADL
ncbi:unnamed protein product [Brassicogethes aeneus]|uniref:Uncharacterized protein n=1 Tax=Brassicogethes aeneus TaxID=1431903 RepID=A0A9P0B0L8_BRAAE|nr:unnamed protein product [Brassicogethes aeneus]